MKDCIFCRIINKDLTPQLIYEDEWILSFMDIEPINVGHILIIPRRHVLDLDELNLEEINRITAFSQMMVKIIKNRYQPDGYSIMQNGGIFNDIGHYHMHLFPRYREDGFGWTFGEAKINGIVEESIKLAGDIKAQLMK